MPNVSLASSENTFDASYIRKKYPYGIVIDDQTHQLCCKLAENPQISVILTGETGTGKEVVTRHIHRMREKKEAVPFVALNCSLLNSDLSESIIFGHKKGAYTGAIESSAGAVGDAEGGILFLDEIHTLEMKTQQRLLRLLNDRTYTRVGESRIRQANFQLLVASTRNLEAEAQSGRFLIDLYMRIYGFELNLPPLRERPALIPDLVALFMDQNNVCCTIKSYEDIVRTFKSFYWQGNIRQLFKTLSVMFFKAQLQGCPMTADLIEIMDTMNPPDQGATIIPEPRSVIPMAEYRDEDLETAYQAIESVLHGPIDLEQTMVQIESALISFALQKHKKIAHALEYLAITRGKLDAKRRKYKLS